MKRLARLLVLLGLVAAACTGLGYQPPPRDASQPIHGEPDGGSGGSM